jgi:hypothetical protein
MECTCGEKHTPGAKYFVSAMDGNRFWLMAGPFPSHPEALEMVNVVNAMACDLDPRACFFAWGTVAMKSDCVKSGRMNELLKIGA